MLVEAGHIVLNPLMIPAGLVNHGDYMDICKAMINKRDAIYFLKGWKDSVGAVEE